MSVVRPSMDPMDRGEAAWYCKEGPRPHRIRRQQRGGGVKELLITWQKNKKIALRKNMVFMHDDAPSHAARLTTEYLNIVFTRNIKIMQWPACVLLT